MVIGASGIKISLKLCDFLCQLRIRDTNLESSKKQTLLGTAHVLRNVLFVWGPHWDLTDNLTFSVYSKIYSGLQIMTATTAAATTAKTITTIIMIYCQSKIMLLSPKKTIKITESADYVLLLIYYWFVCIYYYIRHLFI